MRSKIVTTILFLLILIGCAGGYYYFTHKGHQITVTTNDRSDLSVTSNPKRRLQMKKIPANYQQRASESNRGDVKKISYKTNYKNQNFTKTALVYLPVGYHQSSDQKYNVLYLLHGSTMSESSFLGGVGKDQNTAFKKLLDHEIADKKMKPTIVITPTYYPNRSFVSNNYYDDNKLNLAFATNELPNDLIPVVESRFHTFAKTTNKLGLSESRQHRAFAGFSMGAITTWYVLEHQLDIFKYFIPMAGDSWTVTTDGGSVKPEQTANKLANQIKTTPYKSSDYLILASVGSIDGTSGSMSPMIKSLRNHPQQFTDSNLIYSFDANGGHDVNSVVNQSYNSMQILFRK